MTSSYLERANESRKNMSLDVGTLVWIYIEDPLPGTAVKLNRKWKGPYKNTKVVDEGRAYGLEDLFDGTTLRRAAGKLKKYIERESMLGTVDQRCLTREEEILPSTRARRPPDRLQYL